MNKTPVYILATVLPGEGLEGTLLTFRSLRIGFPTAPVTVFLNGVSLLEEGALMNPIRWVGASSVLLNAPISHDQWVERLLEQSSDPFWICDTDLVFRGSVEGFVRGDENPALLGRYEPPFIEPWTKTEKVSRLHTSLLYLNPARINSELLSYASRYHPKGFPFLPEMDFVRQRYVPQIGKPPLFYDTCSGLYQAIGGVSFTPEQNALFDHLHCGTYASRIEPFIPGLGAAHKAVYADPGAASALAPNQSSFYSTNATGH
jgi:hypothetical protein